MNEWELIGKIEGICEDVPDGEAAQALDQIADLLEEFWRNP